MSSLAAGALGGSDSPSIGVKDAMGNLDGRIIHLADRVDLLVHRLEGVMRPPGPAVLHNAIKEPEQEKSELASMLGGNVHRLDVIIERVSQVLDRLDV